MAGELDMKTLTIGNKTFLLIDVGARTLIGDLSDLDTTAKSSLVAAINELAQGGGGGGGTSDYSQLSNKPSIEGVTLSGNKTASDLGLAKSTDIPSVPTAYTSNPAALGTASPGSSTKWARGDHVHQKPTYSASDVGLGNVDNTSDANKPVSTAQQAALDAKENKVTEVTVSTAGAVSQALDAGKVYHFTGALTSLTITLNAAASGVLAQYHFDFESGSTAPTVTLPNSVTMQGGTFAPEASKRYEVDILNGYGVSMAW